MMRDGVNYDIPLSRVSTDSREGFNAQTLFLALRGDKFDGHEYLDEVYSKGGRIFVCERGEYEKHADAIYITVENTLYALAHIARNYKRLFNIPVVGITGSAGKTTTKELTALFLSVKYNVLKTEGNFNNEIGVPKTLFEMKREHDIVCLETAMNHFGELTRISGMAEPDCALVTNILPVHMEFFQSVSDIALAKAELFVSISGRKTVVFSKDTDYANVLEKEAIRYGASHVVRFSKDEIKKVNESEFVYKGVNFKHNLIGGFNVMNILAALKVAEIYGVSLKEASRVLVEFRSEKNRMQEEYIKGAYIVNDTYNSNPSALKEMISYIASVESKKRILVIGSMLELGERSKEYHEEVGRYINDFSINVVVTFGDEALAVANGLDSSIKHMHFQTREEIVAYLSSELTSGLSVLIKGSRAVLLDEVFTRLKELD